MGPTRIALLLTAAWVAASVAAVAAAQDFSDQYSVMRAPQDEAQALRRVSDRAPAEPHDALWVEGSRRGLLQGPGRRRPMFSRCPRCAGSRRTGRGRCMKGTRVFNCRQRTRAFASRRAPPTAVGQGVLAQGQCLNVVQRPAASASVGGYGGYGGDEAEEEDYEFDDVIVDYSEEEIFSGDTPEFLEVKTGDELAAALVAGANHILVTEHFDATGVTPAPDITGREALNGAIGRVRRTTLSVTGWCEEEPPAAFNLSEPVPPGACAILVREDFLEAPNGTNCLLLDSLYIALATEESNPDAVLPRTPSDESSSSVMILHVSGLMWISNCVFQGSGGNSRAIGMNTIDIEDTFDMNVFDFNGRLRLPELYIKNTTFTSFRRTLAPGIRVLRRSSLYLDGVTFRNIVQPRLPLRLPPSQSPQASAIAAYDNALLILSNVSFEGNEVLGEPAGVRAIAVTPGRSGSQVFATEQIPVWQWPNGPPRNTSRQVSVADDFVMRTSRPQLAFVQSVQQRFVQRRLMSSQMDEETF